MREFGVKTVKYMLCCIRVYISATRRYFITFIFILFFGKSQFELSILSSVNWLVKFFLVEQWTPLHSITSREIHVHLVNFLCFAMLFPLITSAHSKTMQFHIRLIVWPKLTLSSNHSLYHHFLFHDFFCFCHLFHCCYHWFVFTAFIISVHIHVSTWNPFVGRRFFGGFWAPNFLLIPLLINFSGFPRCINFRF